MWFHSREFPDLASIPFTRTNERENFPNKKTLSYGGLNTVEMEWRLIAYNYWPFFLFTVEYYIMRWMYFNGICAYF